MLLKVLGSSSKGNCYLLQGEKEKLIIECGLPYRNILKGLNYDLNGVVGCLVSHEHKDHSKAIKELINYGINVYTSIGTIEALNSEGCSLNSYRLNFIRSEEQIKIGEFTILPFEVQHDANEPLGFLILHKEMGKLLFITDSYYCKYKINGLNHILIECNYDEEIIEKNTEIGKLHPVLKSRLIKSHFSLENVKDFLKETDISKVKEIVLIHLSESNADPERFKDEIEKATGKVTYIAETNLELDLWD